VAAERLRLNVRSQHRTQSMQGDVLKNIKAAVSGAISGGSITSAA
jgi:hypothetical protein